MKIEAFILALKEQNIQYLVDVRSIPQSRFHPQFNRLALQQSLEVAGIQYLYWGKELGGRPAGSHYYDEHGKVSYAAIKQTNHYREAVNRLVNAEKMGMRLALMCSEQNPSQCHRSKLIGESLQEMGVELRHICKGNALKTQYEVMCECRCGLSKWDLFGNLQPLTSVKSYPQAM